MNRMELYLNGRRVDLADDALILLNWERERLDNPTIVRNSYSQTVTLPGTANNRAVLEHFERADRRTTSGSLNALKRAPFALFSSTGEQLASGYFQLAGTERRGSDVSYRVNLFGGLFDLFYSLAYNSDGSARTLADIYYKNSSSVWADPSTIACPMTAAGVYQAWERLRGTGAQSQWDTLNFAPTLQGKPACKFDTNKALYRPAAAPWKYDGLPTSVTDGGKNYGPLNPGENDTVLLEFAQAHNEWEAQDLRCYLQRPVVRVKTVIEAIVHEVMSRYTINLAADFFRSSNPYWEETWLTLPMYDRDNSTAASRSAAKLADYLRGTRSPADYLISYAKTFGLVFYMHPDGRTIDIMRRDSFYAGGTTIDIDSRIDRSQPVSLAPLELSSKWYEMTAPMQGRFAEDYAKRNGQVYGSQRIDTGYEFEVSPKVLTEGNAFKGCADVLDANLNYRDIIINASADGSTATGAAHYLKFAGTDTVKYMLYTDPDEGGETESKEFHPAAGYADGEWTGDFDEYTPGRHFMALPELTDGEKTTDGADILLLFNGMVDTPAGFGYRSFHPCIFHISQDDEAALELLNGGVPCWDMTLTGAGIQRISKIPAFNRWFNDGGDDYQLDYGNPVERAQPVPLDASRVLWPMLFRNYYQDRFDADARVCTAWVDLRGLQPGEGLLRNLWWFDGCLWALNRIENYALGSDAPVRCEFVKVKNENNYKIGQEGF